MQIVKFYRDEKEAEANQGRTFILTGQEDLDQVAEDTGFHSYRVVRRKVDYLELTSIEVVNGELFGVAFKADKVASKPNL